MDRNRIGERVIVRNILRSPVDYRPFECWTFGSECDGAFAQYAKAPARETHKVDCDWSDAELASIPCAYSTAENLLHRVSVGAERVLVTGASGGVGSAAVQLAKRRGAHVIAVASTTKADTVRAIGADEVVDRRADLVAAIGHDDVDVVIDLVAGTSWPRLLDVLRCGGRYATAGAIAGPLVELDVWTLYLKDLTLFGCTFQEDEVFILRGRSHVSRDAVAGVENRVDGLHTADAATSHAGTRSTVPGSGARHPDFRHGCATTRRAITRGACALMTDSERQPVATASLLPVILRRQAEA